MHGFMVRPFLFICTMSLQSFAAHATDFHYVRFHSFLGSNAHQEHLNILFDLVHGREAPAVPPKSILDPDYPTVSGNAWFYDSNANLRRVSFATVSNRNVFNALIEAERLRRGDDAEIVEFEPGKFLVRNPPPKPPVDKRLPTIAWSDAYYAFHDGMVIFASDKESMLGPISKLKPLCRDAIGKDYYFVNRPLVGPKPLRDSYLQSLEIEVGVRKQRRDNEGKAAFQLRRHWQENYFELMRMYNEDVERIDLEIQMMRVEDRPRITATVTARSDSPLEKFIADLPGRGSALPNLDSAIAEVSVDLKLPDTAVDNLHAIVDASPIAATEFGECIKGTIDQRHLEWSMKLLPHDESLVLINKIRLAEFAIMPRQIGQAIGATPSAAGRVVHELPLEIFGQSFQVFSAFEMDAEQLRVTTGLDKPPAFAETTPTNSERVSKGLLAAGAADFSALASLPIDHPIRRSFDKMERAYFRYATRQLGPAGVIPGGIGPRSNTAASFKSVLPQMKPERSYTADFKLTKAGRKLVFNASVSNGLFALWERRRIANFANSDEGFSDAVEIVQ